DVHEFWKENNFYPAVKDIIGHYDVIVTSEPTFVGGGRYLREEMLSNKAKKEDRRYSTRSIMEMFAVDRRILYEQLLLPCLQEGIDVYQSRSFSTSIAYQRQMAIDAGEDISIRDILTIPGNEFCSRLGHCMDYLVIPTVNDFDDLMGRLKLREKKDDCIFENVDFKKRLKQAYESEEFKQVSLERQVNLQYMDAGVSLDYSKEQAREFYHHYLAELSF
ncbi:hypothetical protein HYX11_05485, partial [Candidatus Woesearchaeota archaeon]|nr:hypothetical protein [Candidatus Woesearchaeota archaeon]